MQIKARSNDVKFGSAGLFANLKHEFRTNYWFVFYSQRMDTIWIMSSKEFIEESRFNKSGKHKDKRTVALNGRNTKLHLEHVKPQFAKYVVTDFSRIVTENPDK